MARQAWRLWDDKLSEEYVFSVNPSSDSGSIYEVLARSFTHCR